MKWVFLVLMTLAQTASAQVVETEITQTRIFIRFANGFELEKTKGQLIALHRSNGQDKTAALAAFRAELQAGLKRSMRADDIRIDFNPSDGTPLTVEWVAR